MHAAFTRVKAHLHDGLHSMSCAACSSLCNVQCPRPEPHARFYARTGRPSSKQSLMSSEFLQSVQHHVGRKRWVCNITFRSLSIFAEAYLLPHGHKGRCLLLGERRQAVLQGRTGQQAMLRPCLIRPCCGTSIFSESSVAKTCLSPRRYTRTCSDRRSYTFI